MIDIISKIFQALLKLVPVFRIGWLISTMFGIAMMIISVILRRNPVRKKSPWIVGGIGLALTISSGTQLIFSFLYKV